MLHQLVDRFGSLELDLLLRGHVREDLEHHRNDNVQDDPLDENVEDHEVDSRPDLATNSNHHVSHCWPVIDDHEGVESDHALAQVIEVDQVVEIVWNA